MSSWRRTSHSAGQTFRSRRRSITSSTRSIFRCSHTQCRASTSNFMSASAQSGGRGDVEWDWIGLDRILQRSPYQGRSPCPIQQSLIASPIKGAARVVSSSLWLRFLYFCITDYTHYRGGVPVMSVILFVFFWGGVREFWEFWET